MTLVKILVYEKNAVEDNFKEINGKLHSLVNALVNWHSII